MADKFNIIFFNVSDGLHPKKETYGNLNTKPKYINIKPNNC